MTTSAEWWPWLIIAGLGLYHGINPAMGWLFAVALGLHRKSRGIVLLSLVPIALGHAASVAAVLFALLTLGLVVDRSLFAWIAAGVLVGWAAWHAFYGHRGRVLVGMQTGLAGILVWSFVTASAQERARRRARELAAQGAASDEAEILADIERRDERDRSRAVAPLAPAPDAHLLDTTHLDIDAAVRAAIDIVKAARAE